VVKAVRAAALAALLAFLPATAPAQSTFPGLYQYCNAPAWTIADQSGASLAITTNTANYCKTGQVVTFTASITYPITANGSGARINPPTTTNVGGNNICLANAGALNLQVDVTGGLIVFWLATNSVQQTNAFLSGATIYMNCTYLTTS
jgi:hypothetical protein